MDKIDRSDKKKRYDVEQVLLSEGPSRQRACNGKCLGYCGEL